MDSSESGELESLLLNVKLTPALQALGRKYIQVEVPGNVNSLDVLDLLVSVGFSFLRLLFPPPRFFGLPHCC